MIKRVTGWINSVRFPGADGGPGLYSRVCRSLRGFGFLAFTLLVFFLQSVHVSSEQVGVRLGAGHSLLIRPAVTRMGRLGGGDGKKNCILTI